MALDKSFRSSHSVKKILLVSAAFAPEISPRSFRATELAIELSKKGHDVSVMTICREFNYRSIELEYNIKIKIIGDIDLKPIAFTSSSKLLKFCNRLVVRLMLMIGEYPNIKLLWPVFKSLQKETNNYDLLISFAVPYPVHWGCALFKKKKDSLAATWVADCGDPFVGDKNDTFRKLFYFKWVEKWMFRKYDFITITREDFKVNYFQEFHQKIRVIPQGFRIPKKNDKITNSHKVPTFAFAGALLGRSRSPAHIFKALRQIGKPFKFIFYTSSPDPVKPFQLEFGDFVEIFDVIPRDQLLEKLKEMDFLVNLEYDRFKASPSKLIDYAISGKPILNFNNETRINDTKVLGEFLVGNYQNAFVVQNLEQYNIENVADQFLNLIHIKEKSPNLILHVESS
jgi:glycosyltransferase involved in cell wall biosynthesis